LFPLVIILCFFYMHAGWMDWLLAGCNSKSMCLIGLNGSVLDVSSFVGVHPGSPETLLDHAGGDCAVLIHEVGHSSFAYGMMKTFEVAAGVDRRSRGAPLLLDAADSTAEDDCEECHRAAPSRLLVCKLEARLGLERRAATRLAELHVITMAARPVEEEGSVGTGSSQSSSKLMEFRPVVSGRGVTVDAERRLKSDRSASEGIEDDGNIVDARWIVPAGADESPPGVVNCDDIDSRLALSVHGGLMSGQYSCSQFYNGSMWLVAARSTRVDDTFRAHSLSDGSRLISNCRFVFGAVAPHTKMAHGAFVTHCGQCRTFYEPLWQEWKVWWSCCSVTYSLSQAAINKESQR
jgi:hypothetical protein